MKPGFLIFGFGLVSCVPNREMLVLHKDPMVF